MKPTLIKNITTSNIEIQPYQRYLPTAFSTELSMLEKINMIIHDLHKYSLVTVEMLGKWNEVYKWVMDEGLTEEVKDRLDEFINDGVFKDIIEGSIFPDFENRLDETENELTDIGKNIDGLYQLINSKDDTHIYVSKNEPIDAPNGSLWLKVVE